MIGHQRASGIPQYARTAVAALVLLTFPLASCVAQAPAQGPAQGPAREPAQGAVASPWDSVGRILKSTGTLGGGYYRYNFPRRDIALRVGDVAVAPAIALGTWAGFSGEAPNATMMGDLVLLSSELKPTLAALAQQRIAVSAIHNHLAGESPQLTYVHFHADGNAIDLAARLDVVLSRSATPRPVTAAPPAAVTIDTALVFGTLGVRGRAQGSVAQMSVNLVPGEVQMHGRVVNAAMAHMTPINLQQVGPDRVVATGDFTVLGARVDAVTRALATNGIVATAVHSHLVDEQPAVRYVHFWADGTMAEVLRGLRAALDAGRGAP